MAITTTITSANVLTSSVDLPWTVSWGTGTSAPYSVTISGDNGAGTVYSQSLSTPTSGTVLLTTLTPGATYVFTITASAYNASLGETVTSTSNVTVNLKNNVKYWNGSAWTTVVPRYWTGAIWEEKGVKTWNGSNWI
jgi:hypothetical protein